MRSRILAALALATVETPQALELLRWNPPEPEAEREPLPRNAFAPEGRGYMCEPRPVRRNEPAQLSIRFPDLRPPIRILYATVPVCNSGDKIELSGAAPGARYSVRRGHSINARIDP